ncbi:hypothetical protein ABZT06_41560 [Streptomyces sp. NPDC005483]|uniref:hypothetical protein n=1 Tax=Streptomyces sp. NPDC005483 TaxID=3154882 RepID=UPI0033BED531
MQLLDVGAVDHGHLRGAPLGEGVVGRRAGDGRRGEDVGAAALLAEDIGYRPDVQGGEGQADDRAGLHPVFERFSQGTGRTYVS